MKEASSLSLIESVQVVFRGYLGQLISPFGPGILLGRMIYLPFQKQALYYLQALLVRSAKHLSHGPLGFWIWIAVSELSYRMGKFKSNGVNDVCR